MNKTRCNVFVNYAKEEIKDGVEQSNYCKLELYVSLNRECRPILPEVGESSFSQGSQPIKQQTDRIATCSQITDKSLSYRIQSKSSDSINCDRICIHDFGEKVIQAKVKFVYLQKNWIHKLLLYVN